VILDTLFTTTKILGICLGHQLICKYFGSEIIYADEICHGKVDIVYQENSSKIFL
jgi:anthranilate/para-aminobenzoate synthase component II